ncbi:MAG: TlpA family protein disulfide reductase [Gammaproteobacteria bacterium]|nr:TlpA family protein disulfide reductase [Gammaproteobacteria bacterium]MBU1653744.1 TlpA family protein disulfide reductase [Gammaproteobacteria bacterium]MBU1959621.1 TlpA family protein disulfide reductase [Gammaproteobacteria bacterium]
MVIKPLLRFVRRILAPHPFGASAKICSRQIFGFIALLLLLTACGQETPRPENGQPAPEFSLNRLDGTPLSLKELRGQVVALRFWADWCPFCKEEMTALRPLYDKHRQRGLALLAVNVRQDRATAEAFVRKLGIQYPALLDEEGEVARRYGVNGLPTTFFIDRKGILRGRVLGESTPETFERIAAPLLAEGETAP